MTTRKPERDVASAPIHSAGTLPPNHKGPYRPTHSEMLEGARAVAKAQERIAADRSKKFEDELSKVFKNWGRK